MLNCRSHIISFDSEGDSVFQRVHKNQDGRDIILFSHEPIEQDPVGDSLSRELQSSELRWHPFRREWIIYAPARQNRTFKPSKVSDPLAPMEEGSPPTEIPFSDFDIAVFENRFPSLHENPEFDREISRDLRPAKGRCEVLVYGPEHEGSLATLSQKRRRLLVEAWIDRYQFHYHQGREFVFPFENRGDEVGVTLHHPHGQIYAFNFVPPVQASTVQAFDYGYDLASRLDEWSPSYEVERCGPLSLFAPPFARFPFELWIASRNRRRGLWNYDAEEKEAYAHLLGSATRRYDSYFSRAAATMMSLHSTPLRASDAYQFTTQFYPILRSADKVKYLASVEQSSGVFTVDVTPEFTAQELRS